MAFSSTEILFIRLDVSRSGVGGEFDGFCGVLCGEVVYRVLTFCSSLFLRSSILPSVGRLNLVSSLIVNFFGRSFIELVSDVSVRIGMNGGGVGTVLCRDGDVWDSGFSSNDFCC